LETLLLTDLHYRWTDLH